MEHAGDRTKIVTLPPPKSPTRSTGTERRPTPLAVETQSWLERMQAIAGSAEEACPRCGTAGTKAVKPCGFCTACHDREVSEAMRDAGALREHQDARLEDFSPAEQAAGMRLLDEPELVRGIVLTGAPGPGKTRFLAALAREALGRHVRVVYGMARELLRRTWNPETQDEVIRSYSSADVMLVDDLGHEGSQTPGVVGTLHEVISKRHGNFLPTAISLNITLAEIGRFYDRAIEDRLASWLPIVMSGPSRRRR